MQTVCGKAPVASAMVRKNIIGLPCSLCQPTLWCRVVKNELVPPCSRVLSAVVLLLLLVSLTYKVCCYFQSTSCPFFQCFGCFMLCVQFRVCVRVCNVPFFYGKKLFPHPFHVLEDPCFVFCPQLHILLYLQLPSMLSLSTTHVL